MAEEKIIDTSIRPQVPEFKSGLDVVPITMAEAESAGIWDMHDLEIENPFEDVPTPPKALVARLEKRDLVWRWLSVPMVRKRGTRGWTVYSPDSEDRTAMARGDCPAGVRVDVENKLCWREDAFLGVMPRRQLEAKQAQIAARTQAQQGLAKRATSFEDAGKRAKSKTSLKVQERRGQDFPDD